MSNSKELIQVVNDLRDTLLTKREAYGNAFNNAPDILTMLYPNGIQPESYGDVLTIVRIIDKLYRIANQADTEDPWEDIAGYAVLALEKRSLSSED